MHTVIATIVKAKDSEEAMDNAKAIFQGLTGEGGVFDYFVTFDENGMGVSGSDRWGKLKPVMEYESEEGKKMVADLFGFTKANFEENYQEIKKAIEAFTLEELWTEKTDKKDEIGISMFRYRAHCLGQYKGSEIRLYDNEGEGISKPSYLEWALKLSDEDTAEGMKIWVVPADVHM